MMGGDGACGCLMEGGDWGCACLAGGDGRRGCLAGCATGLTVKGAAAVRILALWRARAQWSPGFQCKSAKNAPPRP